MGMLEDDLQRPDKPCGKCGSRGHWERDCFMNASLKGLPPGTYSATFDDVKMTPKGPVVTGIRNVKPIDTSELGPIKVPTPDYRQRQARVVREALEAAALAEAQFEVAQAMIVVARRADTETLAYLARLLKG